ncbi:hypothetical protein TNIN_411331 [Trichonephila inaurata madagascariensis]|uniref:Uncharacterized protein n=1 Tax=Trichonephila inaurata madagascariensis TaxID=2747483 RepID=A0A8X7CTK6_9ARAC|nr:hypothetical protein TNIN_411331 [Trichonephila inaurata madagascariensis]
MNDPPWSPSPPLMPPSSCNLEEQSLNLASNCGNLIADIENIIKNIEDYYFINDNENNQYASKLLSLFTEGIELWNNLKRTEDNHYSACFGRINQRHDLFNNNDTPFTPVKGKKNHHKSSTLHLLKKNKPKTDDKETSNKYRNLTTDDSSAPRNEGNENVIQPLPPKTPEVSRF